MHYLRPLDRRGSDCHKWDAPIEGQFGFVPMGVADLDFAAPDFVLSAVAARAAHPAYSYSLITDEHKAAVFGWLKRHRGVDAEDQQLRFTGGVIAVLYAAVHAFTQPGDGVVIQSPIYGPFFSCVRDSGRKVVDARLARHGDRYTMDYAAIEDAFKQGSRLFLLCNPHNPVGRVWMKEELERLYALAARYDVIVVADEIHADITLPGHPLTCALTIVGARERTVMVTSASKSFNLAGLSHAYSIIYNPDIAQKIDRVFASCGMNHLNVFGPVATTAAYTHGDDWLAALVEAIDQNRAYAEEFIARELPGVTCARLEGTYLMWLDIRALGIPDENVVREFVSAGVGVQPGGWFGEAGKGFIRLNIGCPMPQLATALDRIRARFFA